MLHVHNGHSNRRTVSTVCGVIGLALVLGATGHAWSTANHANYLTFSKAVALPDVVLPPGSYTFEVANVDTSGNVVRVSSRNGRQQHFMGFTERVRRPAGIPRNQAVSLGEAGAGSPVPITVWYPLGESEGYQFIYR